MTYAPVASTLIRLANSVINSKPPHSRHNIAAFGIPILRYSLSPDLMDSMSMKKKLASSSLIALQITVIITKLKVYDMKVASPSPWTSILSWITNR